MFVAAIKRITDESMQAALSFKKFKAETGASVEELQRWVSVADEVNSSGQAVAESIKAITSNQEKIKLGQGNISGYQLLGINPNQDPFKILEQLRTKTRGLSQAMKKNALEQMGVNKDLLQVLELSKEKFDEMKSSAFVLPESTIQEIDKARASSMKLGNALKFLKGLITAELAPSIIKINKNIMEWIKNNKEGLVKTIKTVFDWLYKITKAIFDSADAIDKVIKSTIGWDTAMKLIIGAILWFNRALLLSPIGLFTVGMILLFALIQDIARFTQGKKSLLGKLMDKDNKLGVFLENLRDIAVAVHDLFTGDYSKMDKLVEQWGVWGKTVETVAIALKDIAEIIKFLSGYDEELKLESGAKFTKDKRTGKTKYTAPTTEESIKNVERMPNWVRGILGFSKDDEKNKKLFEDIEKRRMERLNKNTTINNTIKVDIHGNADKKDTYDAVDQALNKQNKILDGQLGYQE